MSSLALSLTLLICLLIPLQSQAADPSADRDAAAAVAAEFLNSYILAIPSFQGSMDAARWVEKSRLATPDFKKRLSELYRRALKEDPELGYGADAVLGAQDYPESFRVHKISIQNGMATAVLRGTRPFEMDVPMVLIREGNSWLVDGSGDLVPKKR
ncbi:MAG: hypothetical protein Fur0032_13200 [Terrimicrobiaceae bacterium]